MKLFTERRNDLDSICGMEGDSESIKRLRTGMSLDRQYYSSPMQKELERVEKLRKEMGLVQRDYSSPMQRELERVEKLRKQYDLSGSLKTERDLTTGLRLKDVNAGFRREFEAASSLKRQFGSGLLNDYGAAKQERIKGFGLKDTALGLLGNDLRFAVDKMPDGIEHGWDSSKMLMEAMRRTPLERYEIEVPVNPYLASEQFKTLQQMTIEHEQKLAEEHEVGIILVNFSPSFTFRLVSLGYHDPALIIFHGMTDDKKPLKLVQNISQINILFTTLPRLEPTKPKRKIGFHTEPEPA